MGIFCSANKWLEYSFDRWICPIKFATWKREIMYAACVRQKETKLSSAGDAPRKYNILNRRTHFYDDSRRVGMHALFVQTTYLCTRHSATRYLLVGFIYLRAWRDGGRSSPRLAISRALLPLFRLAKSRVTYFKFGTVTRSKIIAVVYYRAFYQLRVCAHLSRRRTSR